MNQLIITPELLNSMNACKKATDFITANNLWGQPDEVVVSDMLAAGMTKEIEWWTAVKKTPKFIEAAGNYTYGPYRTYNPLTNEFTTFNTLAEAQTSYDLIRQEYLDANMSRFSVDLVVQNPNNTASWTPVNLELLSSMGHGDYQVFNTFTGTYYETTTASQAHSDVLALQNQFLDTNLTPIQQEIISPYENATAWINVPSS